MAERIVGTRGGPGSTAVVVDDLDRLAAIVAGSAEACAREAARIDPGDASRLLWQTRLRSPVTGALAETALYAALAGPRSPAACARELGDLAGRLRDSAAGYRRAEAAQVRAWRQVDVLGGFVVGLALPAAAVGAAAAGAVLGRVDPDLPGAAAAALGTRAAQALADDPDRVGHVVNAMPGVLAGLAGRVVPPALGLASASALADRPGGAVPPQAGALARLFDPGRFRVAEAPVPVPVPVPVDLADLARLLLPGSQPPPGWVDVHGVPVRRPDGTRSTAYLVVLPGTEDWSPPWAQAGSPHARDLGSNAQLMAVRRTELTRALPELLDRAGVPPGALVTLVGHSQGGLVAMQAAADAALRDRVSVTDVVTFAAPVALLPPPPGVHVLSLENARDIVPEADGADNPDRLDHLTVTFDAGPTPAGSDVLAFPHAMERHLGGAAAVDEAAAGADPSLSAVLAGLRARLVLAPRGAPRRDLVRSRRFVVTVDRSPPPRPAPGPPPLPPSVPPRPVPPNRR